MSRVDSELRQSEAFSRQNPQRSPVHQNLFNIWDRQHSCISIKLELALSVRDESIASPADVYDVGGQDSTSTEMYWWLSVIVLFRGNVRASVFASRWIVKDCVNRPTIRHASNHGCETDGNNRCIGSRTLVQNGDVIGRNATDGILKRVKLPLEHFRDTLVRISNDYRVSSTHNG